MPGVFISKGMTVSVPQYSIRINEDGDIESDPVVLHVRFDVCPTWVGISLRHLSDAVTARQHRDIIWGGTDEEAKANALEQEFEASMQAITAAAIAIDAFYGMLQPYVQFSPSVKKRCSGRRPSRYAQVAEVLRRAYKLKPKETAALRANVKEIYRVRDLAVHPSGEVDAAVYHRELDVGVEWRFAYFRASNAEKIVYGASWILWNLCRNAKPISGIENYSKSLSERLDNLFPHGHPWEASDTPLP